MAEGGIEVIIPPTRAQRQTMPKMLQRQIARLRNRVETSFKEITDQMELADTARTPSKGCSPGPLPSSPSTPSCSLKSVMRCEQAHQPT
jgi:hypothetical protein